MMRVTMLLGLAACGMMLTLGAPTPSFAGGKNPHGYGMYSPAEPPVRRRPRLYRYDPRSWYYDSRGYYIRHNSGYWVPRSELRYQHHYKYVGPQYGYLPAWGFEEDECRGRRRCR
jgi:hypothetical protein